MTFCSSPVSQTVASTHQYDRFGHKKKKNSTCLSFTLITDRNSADPSAFSDDITAASLLVKDRAMSEKRLLSADCGTLQSVSKNVLQNENHSTHLTTYRKQQQYNEISYS